jgi:type IV pilus assembly protein PilO
MAISFREQPWYVQAFIYVLLTAALILIAWYLPMSPLNTQRARLAQLRTESESLQNEIRPLEVMKRRHAEFRSELEALEQQLDALKAIVPEEKEVDDFIRMVQQTASSANVAIRRLTAKPVVPRDYHVDMPFELEVDGPYDSIQSFFAQLGRLSRITNIGDLDFQAITEQRAKKFQVRSGTTVAGTLVVTTFYTKGAEPPAPAKPGKAAKKGAAKKAGKQ